MIMNRRNAIRQLFEVAGGMAIATSCSGDRREASIALRNVRFSADDEELLKQLAEAVIPETDSPGAASLNLHLFVMKMVDDCHSPEEQEGFAEGLRAAKRIRDKTPEETLAYLQNLPPGDPFLGILKRRTIQGYLNSEYVMKNKLIYELVPGRYDGAAKVNA